MMASDNRPSRTATSNQFPRSATSGGLIPLFGGELIEYAHSYVLPAVEPEPWEVKRELKRRRKPRRPVPNERRVVPRLRMSGYRSATHQAALAVRQLRA